MVDKLANAKLTHFRWIFLFSLFLNNSLLDQVLNPGHASSPIICGYNSGQHMFVPASDQCNTIQINIDTGSTTTTRWMGAVMYSTLLS